MKEHSILDKIRKEFQADCEKVRGKSIGYKLEYFLMYYKIPLLLTIVAAAIVLSLLYSRSQYKESAFSALFVNAENTLSDEILAQEFGELLEVDEDKYMISIDSSLYIDGNSQASIASTEKLAAAVNTQLLDVCIMPEELFLIYAEQECYGDLRNFLSKEQLETYAEKMVYQNDIPVGIYVEDFSGIADAELYASQDRPVFGIVYNTEHGREGGMFLDFLAGANSVFD